MSDFKDILQKYKNELIENGYEANSNIDTMDIIEGTNAKITHDSKKYKESDKCIFKQELSYESAEQLVKLVGEYQEYSVYNLSEYKDYIYQDALFCFEKGENPIEMLVYSIRQLSDKVYKNAILDLIKDLVNDYRSEVIDSFRNILIHWIWEDCIEFVLDSIRMNFLEELKEDVYEVFMKRYVLRVKAADTLIDIEAKDKFVSMVNYLVVNITDSREDTGIMKDIMYRLGKNSEFGSIAIYKVYLSIRTRNAIKRLLQIGIKNNLRIEIYNDMEKKLQNKQIERFVHNQILDLLSYTSTNSKSKDLLKKCSDYQHIDKKKLDDILIDDIEEIIEVILNRNADIIIRKNSIIKLVKIPGRTEEEKIEVLEKVSDENDLLKIVSASALTQLGRQNEIKTLIKYLLGSSDEEMVNEALNQTRRLKSIHDTTVNNALTTVIGRFMENDEIANTPRILRLLEIYAIGIPDAEISEVFLKKLSTTKHEKIKIKLLEFFSKNYSILQENAKERIRQEITKLTYDQSVAPRAMEALKKINITNSNLPESIN